MTQLYNLVIYFNQISNKIQTTKTLNLKYFYFNKTNNEVIMNTVVFHSIEFPEIRPNSLDFSFFTFKNIFDQFRQNKSF
jgi:hypothetical protein